jgi:hypothetical protein
VSTRSVRGTSIPAARASAIIAYSFSGTDGKRIDSGLTIHEPLMPSAGIVNPPEVSMMAENLRWMPASEKRSAGSRVFSFGTEEEKDVKVGPF